MSKDKKKKYYAADQDKLQKKLETIGSGLYFKPKEGKNQVRILPPYSDNGLWYYEATLHYGLHSEDGKEKAYPCLKMFDKDCPICAKREELLEGDGEDKKIADRLRPRTKFYANILDRKTNSVKIWGFSQKTLGILLSYCSDPDYGDISHPEEGFDVIIERTGTTLTDTKYQVRCRPKPSEVGDDTDWENQLHNLDKEVIEEVDEDTITEIVEANFGKVKKSKKKDEDEDEDSDEDEEDEEPYRKKKSKSDEDEEDEDEDEEEEDKPRKKKKSKSEDDEDEDEDDEEDSPKDKKKKKKHKKDDEEEDDEDEDEDED